MITARPCFLTHLSHLWKKFATIYFSDESIVSIKAENSASFLALPTKYNPVANEPQNWKVLERRKETLRFIPYYARVNRAGKGMMRVCLRIK
jgi:hypothetical protein